MKNRDFAQKLEKRTREFAVVIIRLSSRLPKTPEAHVVKNQTTKAGTSIGANYREANRARSQADFRNKIKICEGEASETQYWLELIVDLDWLHQEEVEPVFKECSELLEVVSKPLIVFKSKARADEKAEHIQ